jgi:hypothetical protein
MTTPNILSDELLNAKFLAAWQKLDLSVVADHGPIDGQRLGYIFVHDGSAYFTLVSWTFAFKDGDKLPARDISELVLRSNLAAMRGKTLLLAANYTDNGRVLFGTLERPAYDGQNDGQKWQFLKRL